MLEKKEKALFLRKKNAALNKSGKKDKWVLTSMLLPGVIQTFIFAYLPMFGLTIAFKDYKYNLGLWGSKWNGLKNFEFILSSNFGVLLRNTLGYNILFIVLGMLFSIFLALCLDCIRRKSGIRIFQGSMFLPYFLSWVVVSYISHTLFSYDTGFINRIITALGGEKVSFYSEQKYWPFILTFFAIWKSMGYRTLVFYGSILGIDSQMYDAAAIDGCNYVQKVWYITLPQLKYSVIILLLLSLGGIFRSDFGMFYYLPKDAGILYPVTDTLDTYITRSLRTTGSIGASSAVGFLQSVVGFITIVTVNHIVKKMDDECALF